MPCLFKETKKAIKSAGYKPQKKLGQNFSVSFSALKKTVQAAELKASDLILEIGSGTGSLTKELAKTAKKVLAVEKDKFLFSLLKQNLAEQKIKNIELVNADARFVDFEKILKKSKYKAVANLPFYLTAMIIRKFLESKNKPEVMVFLVQKEMAQRISAKPPKMNKLAASVQFYAAAEIAGYVSKKSFWPKPKVDGAIIKITPFGKMPATEAKLFFQVVNCGFSQPRKQLINNFANLKKVFPRITKKKIIFWLEKNQIEPTRRPETLTVGEWRKLALSVNAVISDRRLPTLKPAKISG